jgi:hypothetical protein
MAGAASIPPRKKATKLSSLGRIMIPAFFHGVLCRFGVDASIRSLDFLQVAATLMFHWYITGTTVAAFLLHPDILIWPSERTAPVIMPVVLKGVAMLPCRSKATTPSP